VDLLSSSNLGGAPASTGLSSGRVVECMGIGHDILVFSCSGSTMVIFSEIMVGLRVRVVGSGWGMGSRQQNHVPVWPRRTPR
jgi:hypothetical protein